MEIIDIHNLVSYCSLYRYKKVVHIVFTLTLVESPFTLVYLNVSFGYNIT